MGVFYLDDVFLLSYLLIFVVYLHNNQQICIFAVMINEVETKDIYEYSNGELASWLGDRFKEYRRALGLSQKQVSLQSGVSVMTIVRFERGEGNSIRLDNLIALLRAIQRLEDITELIPDLPPSLYPKKRR